MSLKKNILANYASQIYVTLIGIVIVPLYIKYMGAEAYGLVGFFAMLQAWFSLLDIGLTPMVGRETARFRGGAVDVFNYRRLVRALEGIFVFVAVVGGGVMFAASTYIARDWLTATHLPIDEVQISIELIAIIIALRWMGGLYRGVISGSELLVWLGGYTAFISTLRFIGVLYILQFVGTTAILFFSYQLCVALLELMVLLLKAYRLLPVIPRGKRLAWSWAPLKPVLTFSLSIAFTSSVWTLVTQTDKLVLSKILPLAEYGYFSLAVLVAGGVMVISGPVSAVIMPRMAKLEAEGDHNGLIRIYRQTTQLVSVIAGASSVTVAYCAEPLLWAWTGDKFLAHNVAFVLKLYAIGNGVLAVSAFPYYLQYAKGDLHLHLIGNILYMVLLIPTIIWASIQYGAIGAGYVWLALNAIYFVAWIPLVHRRFVKGLNVKWYTQDVIVIYLAAVVAGYCLSQLSIESDSRLKQISMVLGFGFVVLLAGAIASTMIRSELKKIWYGLSG